MLQKNLPEVLARMSQAQNALDIGGWHRPLNAATHVLDINSYETRLVDQAHDPGTSPRFTAATWLNLDICDHRPWPFPDQFFDFSVCSHVLEDIRDPIWVVSEVARVSKAGYLECPSPAVEFISYDGRLVGNAHHRWLVDFRTEPGVVQCRMKSHDLLQRGRMVRATRFHQLDYEQFADGIIWEETISAKEVIFDLGEYYDRVLPDAQKLVHFAPVQRVLSKIQRMIKPEVTVPQPSQDEKGVKYPYY